jgi:hypothetical protein
MRLLRRQQRHSCDAETPVSHVHYIEPIMLMNTPSLRKLRSVRSSEKSVKL